MDYFALRRGVGSQKRFQRLLKEANLEVASRILDVRRPSVGGEGTLLVNFPVLRQAGEHIEADEAGLGVMPDMGGMGGMGGMM